MQSIGPKWSYRNLFVGRRAVAEIGTSQVLARRYAEELSGRDARTAPVS